MFQSARLKDTVLEDATDIAGALKEAVAVATKLKVCVCVCVCVFSVCVCMCKSEFIQEIPPKTILLSFSFS